MLLSWKLESKSFINKMSKFSHHCLSFGSYFDHSYFFLLCDFFFPSSICPVCLQLKFQASRRPGCGLTQQPGRTLHAENPFFSLRYRVHADPAPNSSVGLEDPHLPRTDNLVNCQQMRLERARQERKSAWAGTSWWMELWKCHSLPHVGPSWVKGTHHTLKCWGTRSLVFIIHKKWSPCISDICRALQPLMRWGNQAMPLPSGPQLCLFEYVIIRLHKALWGSVPRVHYTLENVKIL